MDFELGLDDAIILLVGAKIKEWPGSLEICGVTRLEKLIFLLENECSTMGWLKASSDFEACDLGPFSNSVYQIVDLLLSAELLQERDSVATDNLDAWEQVNIIGFEASDLITRNFSLSKRGQEYYDFLVQDIDKKALDEISALKNQFAFLPLRQLIRYVHMRYPEFTLALSV